MDTRKAQRIGKSAFIVSLPKAWATKERHCTRRENLHQSRDNGALTLSMDRSEQDLRARLDISDKIGVHQVRDVLGCYMGGL